MTRRQLQWSAGIVAAIALASGVVFALLHFSAGPGSSADVFFQQSFKDLDGETVSMGRWKDKVVVVNFWATWCPPCLKEIPDFMALQQQYADKNVQLIGIALEDKEPVAEYTGATKINYPVLLGGDNGISLAHQLGNNVNAVPYTLIVDRQGQIIHRHPGELSKKQLLEIIGPLLN